MGFNEHASGPASVTSYHARAAVTRFGNPGSWLQLKVTAQRPPQKPKNQPNQPNQVTEAGFRFGRNHGFLTTVCEVRESLVTVPELPVAGCRSRMASWFECPFYRPSRNRALAKLVAEAVSDGGAICREETIDF